MVMILYVLSMPLTNAVYTMKQEIKQRDAFIPNAYTPTSMLLSLPKTGFITFRLVQYPFILRSEIYGCNRNPGVSQFF